MSITIEDVATEYESQNRVIILELAKLRKTNMLQADHIQDLEAELKPPPPPPPTLSPAAAELAEQGSEIAQAV